MITRLKWAQVEDLALPQHPDQHRWERPVLLAVDQEFGEVSASPGSPRTTGSRRIAWSRNEIAKIAARTLGVPTDVLLGLVSVKGIN